MYQLVDDRKDIICMVVCLYVYKIPNTMSHNFIWNPCSWRIMCDNQVVLSFIECPLPSSPLCLTIPRKHGVTHRCTKWAPVPRSPWITVWLRDSQCKWKVLWDGAQRELWMQRAVKFPEVGNQEMTYQRIHGYQIRSPPESMALWLAPPFFTSQFLSTLPSLISVHWLMPASLDFGLPYSWRSLSSVVSSHSRRRHSQSSWAGKARGPHTPLSEMM